MSVAQQQALVLGSLCLAASIVLAGVLVLSRASRFGVFVAVNFLLAAALFWAQVVYGFSGWRSEILAAAASELPVVLLVCWVCLAQVGGLPARFSSPPMEPVLRHPRLRKALGAAPVFLPAAWGCGVLVGLAWPSPAMQAYASAPPQFLLFKWPISVSEGIWAGLAATVFALAAGSSTSALILRMRNLAFAVSMLALALIAVESAIFAGVRLWVGGDGRRDVIDLLLAIETVMAVVCFLALVLGLALRYTPSVATSVLARLHTAWIPARERFEFHRWRTIASGGARGRIRASYRVEEAARVARLPEPDTEKALAAIQLIAVMKDPAAETGWVTPEAARDLYEMQEEISHDKVLWSKIGAAMRGHPGRASSRVVGPESSQEALRAVLDLTDPQPGPGDGTRRALWFHLVAVAAVDVGLVDRRRVLERFGSQPGYRDATRAYRTANDSLRTRTLGGR